MIGELSVLNCGAGDLKFSFNSDDPMEVERARRCVMDMLRRGYILFVEVGGKLQRVYGFDEKTDCYLVADGPGSVEVTVESQSEPTLKADVPEPQQKNTRRGRKAVLAKNAKATGVAPTAGG